jgi:osmotically-inducible protein OsmY
MALAVAFLMATPTAQLGAQTKPATAATEKTSDQALKDRIAYRFDTNPAVKKYDLKVNVSGGVATISGDVSTEAQKMEAAKLAKVPGVSKVVNEVKVDKDVDKTLAERTKSGLSKTGEAINDAWITAKVKWFFVGEDLLKGSDINVDTTNKVVTLKGTVKSAAARARAVELAKETDGVTRVIDQLTIGTKTTQ